MDNGIKCSYLNYGHLSGHAIEVTHFGYGRVMHGEAVAIGGGFQVSGRNRRLPDWNHSVNRNVSDLPVDYENWDVDKLSGFDS